MSIVGLDGVDFLLIWVREMALSYRGKIEPSLSAKTPKKISHDNTPQLHLIRNLRIVDVKIPKLNTTLDM